MMVDAPGYVSRSVARLLAARVSSVKALVLDHGAAMYVSIRTPEGWRHAVQISPWDVSCDQAVVAESAAEAFANYLDIKDEIEARRTSESA